MSSFEVQLVEIEGLEPIEGADVIEAARVGGYQSIVSKGSYKIGDRVFYIPEASLVPPEIINHLGLTGKLAGKDKNRVKAIRLKGVLSQGLLLESSYLKDNTPELGLDYKEALGITKYEPPVPAEFGGDVVSIGPELTVNFDVEPLKKYPNLFGEITPVTITEKIHGTCVQIGVLSGYSNDRLFGRDKNIYVASKGLGARGLVFGPEADNVYTRQLLKYIDSFEKLTDKISGHMWFIGEIFGKGVQDLNYGTEPTIRFFDILTEKDGYLNNEEKKRVLTALNLPQVPVLYQGQFSHHIVNNLLEMDTVEGDKVHIMEGVVIRADDESLRHKRIGRPMLKAVSDRYLLRKGGTEYN